MPTSVNTSWLISVSCMSMTRLAAAVQDPLCAAVRTPSVALRATLAPVQRSVQVPRSHDQDIYSYGVSEIRFDDECVSQALVSNKGRELDSNGHFSPSG